MAKRTKPKKPRKDFPLTAHANGQWCKKLKGKIVYFGPWDDPEGALLKYLHDRAGVQPPSEGCTVAEMCNTFLTAKEIDKDNGEIREETFADYMRTCRQIVEQFGRDKVVNDMTPDDFRSYRRQINEKVGLVGQLNRVNRTRIVFKFAYEEGLIDRPVRFGQAFKRPKKKALRKQRHEQQRERGLRMFEAADLRTIIKAATLPMRAFILLGVNAGLGASDISAMEMGHWKGQGGWLDYPRPKNENPRRIPLWSETVDAMKAARKKRADKKHVFITREGKQYVRVERNESKEGSIASRRDSVGAEFSKLLVRLKLKRPGISFYALRHTFRTIAGETRDQQAVNAIMGHDDGSMANVYTERISDERLTAVTDFVREWLWPVEGEG